MVMRKLFGRRYYSGGRRAAVSRSAWKWELAAVQVEMLETVLEMTGAFR